MKKIVVLSVAVFLLSAAIVSAEAVKVKLDGVVCGMCAKKLVGDMNKVGKVTTSPTKDKPTATVDLDLKKKDVGDLAKAIADCQTPHRSTTAPAATLIVEVKGLTEDNAKKLGASLEKVKGIDAKASSADAKAKTVSVKLADEGGAKLEDIKKALEEMTK